MRSSLIAITSALALLTASALAQTPAAPGGARAPGATSTTPAAPPKQPKVNPLTEQDISKINGTDVYGSDGKKVGDVSTVLMDPKSKTVNELVVGSGGVLGIGGHHVALPLKEFSWDPEKEGFKISKTADDLKGMPEWQEPATAASTEAGATTGSSTPPSGSTPAK